VGAEQTRQFIRVRDEAFVRHDSEGYFNTEAYFNNGVVATQCRLCNVLRLFGYQHPGDVPPSGVSVAERDH
jgi:hypothetical protein